MKREDLADLMAFAVIAEERSFTRAAVRLGISSSALSHAVRLLEERLGAKLLSRTTRSVAPTAAGERLLTRLRPALAEIDDGLDALAEDRDQPCGLVRINAHQSGAMLHVLPKLRELRKRYPDVVLDLSTDEKLVDIVSAGYDAGIRHGERIASDMVAVPIGPAYRKTVVASARYLGQAPAITTPYDLVEHPAAVFRMPTTGAFVRWEFRKGSRKFSIEVKPSFISNNIEAIIRAAMEGIGTAYVFKEQVMEQLRNRTLVEVLPTWSIPYDACYLYYPDRRNIRPAMRAVIEVLRHKS